MPDLSSVVFLDVYCSTVQGLFDWVEVDLGFPELVFFNLICHLSFRSHHYETLFNEEKSPIKEMIFCK